jgi:hypothetical protein
VDETAFLAANAKRHTQFVTGLVDVTGSRLLDVVPGRSGTVLCQWIGRTAAAVAGRHCRGRVGPDAPMFVKPSAGWVKLGRVRF